MLNANCRGSHCEGLLFDAEILASARAVAGLNFALTNVAF
jgi:hypothetical protein